MVDLGDVATFLKVKAMADHPGTPVLEARNARARLAAMETSHEGITATAARVQQALAGPPPPPPPRTSRAPVSGGISSVLRAAVSQGANDLADRFAGELSGAGRFEPLVAGECDLTQHACGAGQVCLEVRMRASDVRRVRTRERLLDGIEDELLKFAEHA